MQVAVLNQITAKDLNYMSQMRENRHREVYVIILERIYSRIRRCSTVSMKECTYDIPEVVIGFPMFDVDKCTRFVVRHLVMNGFEVSRTAGFIRTLDITWAPEPHSSIGKKKLGKESDAKYFIGHPNFVPAMFNETKGGEWPQGRDALQDDQRILSFRKRPSTSDAKQDQARKFRPLDTFVTHTIMPRS